MDIYLQRCLELARIPGSAVEPNPRVGAVIVHQGKIIGEGFHEFFGGPHAEVNAILSVENKVLLKDSTLYVSLEPCNHVGKTPACTSLILEYGIPKVIIGSTDPNPQMSGKSVEFLRANGVEVQVNENTGPFKELNRHFYINQQHNRPFITLKWAESADGFIAQLDENNEPVRTKISGKFTDVFVHRLRAEHKAIMIGRKTAEIDQPLLNTRLWPGPDPVKIVVDPSLSLSLDNRLFESGEIILINEIRDGKEGRVTFFHPENGLANVHWKAMLKELYTRFNIGSILVEGGARLHSAFLETKLWDDIVRIRGKVKLEYGTVAAEPPAALSPSETGQIGEDRIEFFRK